MSIPVQTPAGAAPSEREPAAGVTVPRRRRTRRTSATADTGGRAWVYVVLSLGLVLLVGPFVWMLFGSVTPESDLRKVPPSLVPDEFTLENLTASCSPAWTSRRTSPTASSCPSRSPWETCCCSMLGYALAKLEFPGRRLMFILYVMVMLMVPGMVTLIPLFVLVSNSG